MMTAGSGLATSRAFDEAALEASLAALEQSGGDHADLVVVFTTAEAGTQSHQLLHVIRRVTGARAVVGASGNGVLTERGEVEGEPAVAVLAVHSGSLVHTPCLIEDQDAVGSGLGAELAKRVMPAESGCLIVLPDPAGLDPRALLTGLDEAVGFVPVVGAVAAGRPSFEICNAGAARGALVGLALSGPEPLIGVAQGCVPIGEPYVITRAEGQLIREIGSRSALEILREAVESVPGGLERIRRAGLYAGLAMDPAKSPLERGDFLVRNVGVDAEAGVVAVAEPVRVGQTIQFQIRDAEASRDDLQAMLGEMAERLGGRRPAFGLYFNCAARGQGLFGVPHHDVTLVRERLGYFPLVGFFGNGEFAPVGRRNFFHNYTGALVVFPAS